jgi:hypothetical protein
MILVDDHGLDGSLREVDRKGQEIKQLRLTAKDIAQIMGAIHDATQDFVMLVFLCCHAGSIGREMMRARWLAESWRLVTNTIGSEEAWALQMSLCREEGKEPVFRYQATVGVHLLGELAHVSAVSPAMRVDVALAQASSGGGLGAELCGWGAPAALARPIGECFRANPRVQFPALRPNEWFVRPSELAPCAFEEEPFQVADVVQPAGAEGRSFPVESVGAPPTEPSPPRRAASAEQPASVSALTRVDFAADGGQWLEAFEQSRREFIEMGTRWGPLGAEPTRSRWANIPTLLALRVARRLKIDEVLLFGRDYLPLRGSPAAAGRHARRGGTG